MASATYLWARILAYIEQHHTEALVNTWFDDVDIVELKDGTLYLYTPNPFPEAHSGGAVRPLHSGSHAGGGTTEYQSRDLR